jgi:hypothetical protein
VSQILQLVWLRAEGEDESRLLIFLLPIRAVSVFDPFNPKDVSLNWTGPPAVTETAAKPTAQIDLFLLA